MSAARDLAELLVTAGVESGLALHLAAYGELLLDANRSVNLTAARDPRALVEHILDSLTLRDDVDGPLIDLGSGAGFPGIPLAIATRQRVVLVDSVKKKAAFLGRALSELGLAGEALDARAEALARDPAYREQFRFATARAVSSASTVAELTTPFLAIGGRALLQRGLMDEAERRAVSDAAPILSSELTEERLLTGGDRRVLVLTKRSVSQNRFPRRDGIPEKRPLCVD